ncbi:hypothetical protein LTS08_006506 [Lithohypha guttulata]|nr:hypothetical protein LTS08_006506 [Lithohypha guttulata]
MGFWPFGGAKKPKTTESKRQIGDRPLQTEPVDNLGRLEKAATNFSDNTKSSTKQDRSDKGRHLSKTRGPIQQQQQRSQTAPLPVPLSRRHSQLDHTSSEKDLYQQNPTSHTSLGPDTFTTMRQPPTLYARRSEHGSDLVRRKSSKRKADDYAREREIKAMSTSPIPIPRRPTSFYESGPLRRETRDIPGGLNRRLHRPTSQVSLPLPDDLLDVGDVAHHHTFKVGMFAALSPRPTIKYDENPKHMSGKQPQRPRLQARPSIVEEESGMDKKRIDDLADGLDAGALRELMERDRRRRERKKQTEHARLQRKLERRAERQREEEARKARTEEYVSASASQVQGLDMEPQSQPPLPVHDVEVEAGPSSLRPEDKVNPFADPKSQPTSPVVIRNPFDDEKDEDVLHQQPSDIEAEPPVPIRSPLRKIRTDVVKSEEKPSHATVSPSVSPVPRVADRQSLSQGSLLNREITTDIPESGSFTGGASDHSSQRLSSWTAFFRRGTNTGRKLSSSFQGRSTPSEFSNTSRESFARKQPPPMVTTRTFRRADSSTPQRTTSKFREDLPEFPTPPASRMRSLDAIDPPASSTFNQAVTTEQPNEELLEDVERSAYTTSSPIPMKTNRQENRQSVELDVPLSSKAEVLLSQSLASVDSEGSWLSGKPLRRRSAASQRLQARRSSLTRPMPGTFDGVENIHPGAESTVVETQDADRSAGDTLKKDETWHAALARQPTVVRQAARAKSKEGLLNEYTAKESRQSSTSAESGEEGGQDEDETAVTLGRARSVEYKGHARQISAGSARLLDIRRSSTPSLDLLSGRLSSLSQDRLQGQ